MMFNNAFGLVFVIINMYVSGELSTAPAFFAGSPLALGLLLIRSATFYSGAYALTTLTKENGASTAAAVGTARKSLTVIASYVLFPKPFHINYAIGFLLFLVADLVYLHVGASHVQDRKDLPGKEDLETAAQRAK